MWLSSVVELEMSTRDVRRLGVERDEFKIREPRVGDDRRPCKRCGHAERPIGKMPVRGPTGP